VGRLGGYRVLRVLGEGGMGVVFEAEEQRPLRRVALKVMQPELASGEQARRRFLREGQAAASVEHERVVPVFRVDEAGGVPFLVMPLLPGESLEARLKREPRLPPAEALRIGREAAEGLAAAHQEGLVHRDVKPGNVWLRRPGGSVVLLDFGLARPWQGPGLTASREVLGTLSYMSPEQAAGGEVDHRSDLFSLGCVLYRLCTGKQPFGGAGVLDSTEEEALGRLRPPAEVEASVSAALSDLVMRLLSWKLAWRPLTGATREATAVAALAARRRLATTSLTKSDASAERVLAELPKARYAHLATHGFFADPSFRSVLQLDPGLFETRGLERAGAGALSPMVLSGLVFAGANRPATPGRGLVTGEHLADRDLSGLDLAVLSACETGLGDVAGGEGVFGLQRAFHLATWPAFLVTGARKPPAAAEGDDPLFAWYTGRNERRHPYPVRHRARRSLRRRPTLSADLRRAAPAGGRAAGAREAGADPGSHGPGP
jgi:hypothetical protein